MGRVEDFIEQGWGKRCKTTDREDFPEEDYDHDPLANRCPCCEMWEHYDEFIKETSQPKESI